MPIPTLTANSPQIGDIAWDAFTIQYLGTSYPIAAGYTANKFVWWLYNNGAGGPLQAGDTLPTLTDDDLLLFLNKSGVPVNVQTASIIDGSIIASGSILGDAIAANTISGDKILAGSILSAEIGAGEIKTINLAAGAVSANQIAANTITAGQIAANTITAGQIAAGTITANEIAANTITANQIAGNTITADKLLIGYGRNMVVNPGFEGTLNPHNFNTAAFTPTLAVVHNTGVNSALLTTVSAITTSTNVMNASGTLESPTNLANKVTTGQTWTASVYAKCATGANVKIRPAIVFRSADGSVNDTGSSFNLAGSTQLTTSWQKLTVQATLTGVDATHAVLIIYCDVANAGDQFWIDDLSLMPMVSGDLIVNGAIDGQVITGAEFRTASTGRRIDMNSAGSNQIDFYPGQGSFGPGHLYADLDGKGYPEMYLSAPTYGNEVPASITLNQGVSPGNNPTITLSGGTTQVNQDMHVLGTLSLMGGNLKGTPVARAYTANVSMGGSASTTVNVSFSPDKFTSAPNIIAMSNLKNVYCNLVDPTSTTGCTIRVTDVTGANSNTVTVTVFAVGTLA